MLQKGRGWGLNFWVLSVRELKAEAPESDKGGPTPGFGVAPAYAGGGAERGPRLTSGRPGGPWLRWSDRVDGGPRRPGQIL